MLASRSPRRGSSRSAESAERTLPPAPPLHTRGRTRPLRALLLLPLLLALGAVDAGAQGWIEPRPGSAGVERTRSEVVVHVEGRVARVEVSEWFRNNGGGVAEGEYLYPLSGEAAFQNLSLYQGETELRGELMDAEQARAIYEEIVRRRLDPALVELVGTGLLRARVFPIEPGDTRRIVLRYSQLLPRSGDALNFRYAASTGGDGRTGPMPVDLPRPAIGREGDERPPRMPEGAPTTINVVVEDGGSFLDPFSPTHALEHERTGGSLRIRTSGVLSGRFSLFLPIARDGLGLSLASHAPLGEDGYFMLTLFPGRGEPVAQPRDLVVVLDVSGSMAGEKMLQAQDALRRLLATLEEGDRFRLVAFSNAVRAHSLEWTSATPAAIADAGRWVDRLQADGGTNIGAALREAFRLQPSQDHLPVVIFLTDGLPTVGEQSVEELAAAAERERGRNRLFAFGVGHDVDTHLLDRITTSGRGTTTFVEPGESVERALSLLAARISHPVLTDLVLVSSPVRVHEIYPVELPDVFAGEELVLFGRYETPDETVTGDLVLEGRRAGRTERFVLRAPFVAADDDNGFIPRLWAARKLGFLTRRVWTEGSTPELVEEIRATALRYGLPSEYTAYLVTEPGAPVVAQSPADMQRQQAMASLTRGAADAAQGAGAVGAAREARRHRAVRSEAELEAMEDEFAPPPAAGGDVRRLAGRTFQRTDGVWTDVTRSARETVAVRAFSPAYFDLLRALPELRLYADLQPVLVTGGDLSIRFDENGVERLDDRRLREIVERFRRYGEER